jgi:hypothetical protein
MLSPSPVLPDVLALGLALALALAIKKNTHLAEKPEGETCTVNYTIVSECVIRSSPGGLLAFRIDSESAGVCACGTYLAGLEQKSDIICCGLEEINLLGIMGPGGTDFQDSVAISVQRISLDGMLGHLISGRLQFMLYERHCTGGWH